MIFFDLLRSQIFQCIILTFAYLCFWIKKYSKSNQLISYNRLFKNLLRILKQNNPKNDYMQILMINQHFIIAYIDWDKQLEV